MLIAQVQLWVIAVVHAAELGHTVFVEYIGIGNLTEYIEDLFMVLNGREL